MELRNRLEQGDRLEILAPGSLGESFVAEGLTTPAGAPIDRIAEPMTLFDMAVPERLRPGDMLRLRVAG